MSGSGFVIGLIVGLAAVGIMMLIALTRKANAKIAQPTRRTNTIASALPPDAAFKTLQAAQLGRYRLGDSDTARGALVFVSAPTLFSWGFFYPVFVSAAAGGSSIAIGIKSRAVQGGPVVTKNHKEFTAAVERALAAR